MTNYIYIYIRSFLHQIIQNIEIVWGGAVFVQTPCDKKVYI